MRQRWAAALVCVVLGIVGSVGVSMEHAWGYDETMHAALPAVTLALVTAVTKVSTGWYAAKRVGAGERGRLRAGTALIARGEFSIVIAALGADLLDGPELGALAAGYVLVTAIIGPLAAKLADRIPIPKRRVAAPATT